MRSLAIRRNYRGLSQVELASKTGISVWKISNFELGREIPDPCELRRLAEALGVATSGLRRSQIEVRLRLSRHELVCFEAPGRPRRGWQHVAKRALLPDWFLAKLPNPAPLLAHWIGLLSEFAEPEQKSPFVYGFASCSLLDAHGNNVGPSPLPCLRWNCLVAALRPHSIRVWPQVKVRTQDRTYGVGALVKIESWLGGAWACLDLPEASTEYDWDPGREANLSLPRLLLTRKQIMGDSWRDELERQMSALLPPSEPFFEGLLRSRDRGLGKML